MLSGLVLAFGAAAPVSAQIGSMSPNQLGELGDRLRAENERSGTIAGSVTRENRVDIGSQRSGRDSSYSGASRSTGRGGSASGPARNEATRGFESRGDGGDRQGYISPTRSRSLFDPNLNGGVVTEFRRGGNQPAGRVNNVQTRVVRSIPGSSGNIAPNRSIFDPRLNGGVVTDFRSGGRWQAGGGAYARGRMTPAGPAPGQYPVNRSLFDPRLNQGVVTEFIRRGYRPVQPVGRFGNVPYNSWRSVPGPVVTQVHNSRVTSQVTPHAIYLPNGDRIALPSKRLWPGDANVSVTMYEFRGMRQYRVSIISDRKTATEIVREKGLRKAVEMGAVKVYNGLIVDAAAGRVVGYMTGFWGQVGYRLVGPSSIGREDFYRYPSANGVPVTTVIFGRF
jgi:hypothetical protein